jgi:hypothetical protein
VNYRGITHDLSQVGPERTSKDGVQRPFEPLQLGFDSFFDFKGVSRPVRARLAELKKDATANGFLLIVRKATVASKTLP